MRAFRSLAAAVPGVIALCFLALQPTAGADNYPSRPVHFIVGFTAGGPDYWLAISPSFSPACRNFCGLTASPSMRVS